MCNNELDLTHTALGIDFESSQKHLPTGQHLFLRKDHENHPTFYIQKSPRQPARVHTLRLLSARRSTYCKTSLCPEALSR